jgi:hypothetical protein
LKMNFSSIIAQRDLGWVGISASLHLGWGKWLLVLFFLVRLSGKI